MRVRAHYEVATCDIIFGGKTYSIKSEYVNMLLKECNYFNEMVPTITLTLSLEKQLIARIQKADVCMVNLKILEVLVDKDANTISKTQFMNKVFTMDCELDLGTIELDPNYSFGNKDKEMTPDDMIVTDFLLYDLDMINVFKKEMDFILKSCDTATALTLFLTRRGCNKNVIASVPMVSTKYPDLTIRVGDLMNNIRYCDRVYGLYTMEPMVFNDIDEFYVVDRTQLPVKVKNVKSEMLISPSDMNDNSGVKDDELPFETAYSADMSMVKLLSGGNLVEATNDDIIMSFDGSNVISIDPRGMVNSLSKSDNVAKTKVIRKYNPITEEQSLKGPNSYKASGVGFSDVPLSYFKPYMRYSFEKHPEGPNIYYCMARCTMILSQEQGNMKSQIDLGLIRY